MMIKKIVLKHIPSFADGTVIAPLKAVNYFYGANGTGKTSISRVLAECKAYGECSFDWGVGSDIPIYVYNRDFVEKNFSSKIKGIFTLGEFAGDSIKINILADECLEIEKSIAKEKLLVDGDKENVGLQSALTKLTEAFENECWSVRTKIPESVRPAYTPHQGSKSSFANKIIEILSKDYTQKEHEIATLEEEATEYLNKSIERIPPIVIPDFDSVIHTDGAEILSKRILGKSDVDIAGLIQKLENSDWVRKGKEFLEKSDGLCPFCQQTIPQYFVQELEDYFDESYSNDLKQLNKFEEQYALNINTVKGTIDKFVEINKFIDSDKIKHFSTAFTSISISNLQIISTKKQELARRVQLKSYDEIIRDISEYLKSINDNISKHNKIADNIKENRKLLKNKIWEYTASQIVGVYRLYAANKSKIEIEIKEKFELIQVLGKSLADKKAEIKTLEKSKTGIEASVVKINSMLEGFCFSSFRIQSIEREPGFYRLVRHDGSLAHSTLSEGEKTFITFLYFYNLLMGSHTSDGVVGDRIVVFDDPISSLDSEILFIVNEMIRRLINDNIRKKSPGNIKQFFIFTHNAYFFKEITYKSEDRQKNQNTYYIIRKNSVLSEFSLYDKSPIENSYALLWREMAECKNSITIQNLLRRILEIYFTHFGDDTSIRGLAESFDGKDRLIFSSLMSWSNAGSHSVYDDFYISRDDAEVDRYKNVFKKIFEQKNHLSHYIMMYNKYHIDKISIETSDIDD